MSIPESSPNNVPAVVAVIPLSDNLDVNFLRQDPASGAYVIDPLKFTRWQMAVSDGLRTTAANLQNVANALNGVNACNADNITKAVATLDEALSQRFTDIGIDELPEFMRRFQSLRTEVHFRSGMWGLLGGAIPAVVVLVWFIVSRA